MTEKTLDKTDNPLLNTEGIPQYDQIKPEHVVTAIKQILKEGTEKLNELETSIKPSWEGLLQPLEELDIPFEYGWGPVNHLLGVKNSPELRTAHETVLQDIVAFSLRCRQSPSIYKGLNEIRDNPTWQTLTQAQQRVIDLKIRSAKHAGVGLEGENRTRFIEIEKELSQLNTDFSNHVLDSTKAFSLVITEKPETESWPQNLLQLASHSYNSDKEGKEPISSPEKGPWKITLDMPSYLPFMQHHRIQSQREQLYHEFITRASKEELDNSTIIQRILELRKEKARLLGFKTYAELSLDSKMAQTVDAVQKMTDELYTAGKPFAEKDFEKMKLLAKKVGQDEKFKQWDVAFWSERLREQTFEYTDEELRPYFQLPKVLDGLFSLVNRLFNISIEQEKTTVPKWHPDVQFYHVKNQQEEQIASFFLDPYSRPEEKQGGAWMDECLNRRMINGKTRLPVVHLCCNGTPSIDNKPSLMSFREVETLFHEFGHGLQGMLTTIDIADVAGINGVDWDAVELPSQFMENWCYHKPTLLGLTEHVETGEQLPEELFEKLKASRTFQSGSMTIRQLLFGTIDMQLHHQHDPSGAKTAFDRYHELASDMMIMPPYEHDHFLCAFSHIFAGGYAAGYYSYKWAEVLSADAFAAFEEAGLDDDDALSRTGKLFRDTILSLGGSEHPMEVFKRFRGREPETKALLRHSGFI